MTVRDGKDSEYTFKKSLNLLDSTAIVVGSMIGSGIFIVAAEMSRLSVLRAGSSSHG